MTKLPVVSGKETVKALEKIGMCSTINVGAILFSERIPVPSAV